MSEEPLTEFRRSLWARWGDMDFNGHMRNTAYLDAGGDVRMMFFAGHGFSMREFEKRRIGPVILRDELDYYRELRLLDPVDVTLTVGGGSDDGSHFRLINEFYRTDGARVARVVSTGGWLDLRARRLCAPPDDLATLLRRLPRSPEFARLESLVRRTASELLAEP